MASLREGAPEPCLIDAHGELGEVRAETRGSAGSRARQEQALGLQAQKSQCSICAQGRAVLCHGHPERLGWLMGGCRELGGGPGDAAVLGSSWGQSSLVLEFTGPLGMDTSVGWDKL